MKITDEYRMVLDQCKTGLKEAIDDAKNYTELINVCEQFIDGSMSRLLLAYAKLDEGRELAYRERKEADTVRIEKTTKTKKNQRAVKEEYVIKAYLRMVNDKEEKAWMGGVSENKMAKRVQERVEADLKKVKTSNHRSVLKPKVGRNDIVTFTGLSTKTIIDILRKRDKEKLPFYPWEEKNPSRT